MMKMYPSWFLFFFLNIMGILFILSSSNWLMVWIGFELSLMGFLPLFLMDKLVLDSVIKYMIIQAGGSALLLMSFMVECKVYSSKFLLISMSIKLGMFPFFQWVPIVMSAMPWSGCLLLSTIQKIGPLFMLMKVSNSVYVYMILMGSLGIFFGGMMGLNQSFLRPLLGYSSVSHTSWMVLSVPVNINILLLYMVVYFLLTFILMINLQLTNSNKIISSVSFGKDSVLSLISFLVLMGLPPFSIFFLKMLLLYMYTSYLVIVIILLVGTMMSSAFYLSFSIPMLLKFLVSGEKKKASWKWLVLLSSLFPFLFLL